MNPEYIDRYSFRVIPGEQVIYYTKFADEEDRQPNDLFNKEFIENCQNLDLEALKKQYSLDNIDKCAINNAFQECIDDELLDVLKWLYSSGKVDIHSWDDFVLVLAVNMVNLKLLNGYIL